MSCGSCTTTQLSGIDHQLTHASGPTIRANARIDRYAGPGEHQHIALPPAAVLPSQPSCELSRSLLDDDLRDGDIRCSSADRYRRHTQTHSGRSGSTDHAHEDWTRCGGPDAALLCSCAASNASTRRETRACSQTADTRLAAHARHESERNSRSLHLLTPRCRAQ